HPTFSADQSYLVRRRGIVLLRLPAVSFFPKILPGHRRNDTILTILLVPRFINARHFFPRSTAP
ncbi:MAG: hypothetical protein ABGY75_13280, partial [Gemmataceae bacterium]